MTRRAIVASGGDCDFESAEELLKALDPLNPFWRDDPTQWLFRGQSDDWLLLPKAYREGSRNAFQEFGVQLALGPEIVHFVGYEEAVTTLRERFAKALDKAGFPIPVRPLERQTV